jgi:hypothetical protein
MASVMLVREIAQLCDEANIGIFASAAGRNIFVGEFPDSVNEGIYIVEAISPPPHGYVDTEYTILDFYAVSPHTDRAHELLEKVYNYFHRHYGYTTKNWTIYFSRALGSIVDVDRERESGKLFRLSVQFICRNLNNVS